MLNAGVTIATDSMAKLKKVHATKSVKVNMVVEPPGRIASISPAMVCLFV